MGHADARPMSLPISPDRPSLGPNLASPAPNRLLDLLRPTIHHDLPNMLVAFQGLLQMLGQEENSRLSLVGQDYLQRLTALGQKLQAAVTILRQISKAECTQVPCERVDLGELIREAAATCKQMMPGIRVVFHISLQASEVRVPHSLLSQALLEVMRLLAAELRADELHYTIASRPGSAGVELSFHAEAGPSTPPAAIPATGPVSDTAAINYNLFGADHRLTLILVSELVRSSGGSLSAWATREQGKWIRFNLPSWTPT